MTAATTNMPTSLGHATRTCFLTERTLSWRAGRQHFPMALPFMFIGYLETLVAILRWLAKPSHPGPNEYGPNPNEVPQ